MPSRKDISNEENLAPHQSGEGCNVKSKQFEIYQDCSNRNMFARTQAEMFSNILIFIIKLYIYTVDP